MFWLFNAFKTTKAVWLNGLPKCSVSIVEPFLFLYLFCGSFLFFRDNLCVQAPLAESLHLQSLANDTQEAVRRASDMLKQMESLKTEIKMLLTVSNQ